MVFGLYFICGLLTWLCDSDNVLENSCFLGGSKIETQTISKNTLLITLYQDKHWNKKEISITLDEIASNNDANNIILDFSCVEIITSSIISKLLALQKLQNERGCKLILSNVGFLGKCVFTVTGLKSVFDFADNNFNALAAIGWPPCLPHTK